MLASEIVVHGIWQNLCGFVCFCQFGQSFNWPPAAHFEDETFQIPNIPSAQIQRLPFGIDESPLILFFYITSYAAIDKYMLHISLPFKGKLDKYVNLRTKLILCCFCLTPLCFPANGGVKGVMCFNLSWPLKFIISHDTGLLLCDLIHGGELRFFALKFVDSKRLDCCIFQILMKQLESVGRS